MDPVISSTPHPENLANESLQDSITELAACITVATARLFSLIAALDQREAWGDWGVKSCAHWLNWKCGIGLGAVREKVRATRALASLPLISEAFACGKVSYSKVRAMTRIADPDNEDYLLMIAGHGAASHVEGLVRSYRRVQRNESIATANEAHAMRELNWYWDDDGSFVIKARLPAESGALVLKALEAAVDEINDQEFNENVSAETSPPQKPFSARRADALANIAGDYFSSHTSPSRQADQYQVLVHVDRASSNVASGIGRAEIDRGPGLCPETARRIACDASMVELESDGWDNPLNIGRKSRTLPLSIRRALEHRDKGCRFPGCTNVRHVDPHHFRHWADGDETSTRNLVLLCRHHHRLMHEGGFKVTTRDDRKMLLFTPNDIWIPAVPALTTPGANAGPIAKDAGIKVSAETLLPMWHGESMDMGMAVEGLIHSGDL